MLCAALVPLLLPLPSASVAPAPMLRFDAEPGTAVEKSFSTSLELSFDSMSSEMDGQPVPSEYLPKMEIDIVTDLSIVLVDRYQAVGGGRPTTLLRSFEEIAASFSKDITVDPFFSDSMEGPGESPMEGRTVRLRWSDDEGDYERELEGDADGLGEALAAMPGDMDLLAFLPGDADSDEDAWEVDSASLAMLLDAEEVFAVTWEGGEDPRGEPREQRREGRLRAAWAGERSVDGSRCAVVELDGTITDVEVRAGDLEMVPVADGDATETSTTTYEVEGELLWSLEARRLFSIELAADVVNETVLAKDPGQPGPEFTSTVVLAGRWQASLGVVPTE